MIRRWLLRRLDVVPTHVAIAGYERGFRLGADMGFRTGSLGVSREAFDRCVDASIDIARYGREHPIDLNKLR